MPQLADFDYTDHGSIGTLVFLNDEARDWAEENIAIPDYQAGHLSVHVEARFVDDILRGILDAGLTIASGDLWIEQDAKGDLYGAWSLEAKP